MKNKLFLLILILFIGGSCFASVYNYPVNISTVAKKLPKLENINCKFRQEKVLTNIQKPLVSGGNFTFIKNKGVIFETTYPIHNTVSYTNKNSQQVNEIILALAEKKYYKLDKDFQFYYMGNEKEWTLGLRPKTTSHSKDFIKYVTIEGTTQIKKIIIEMTNGNRTTQWFITK